MVTLYAEFSLGTLPKDKGVREVQLRTKNALCGHVCFISRAKLVQLTVLNKRSKAEESYVSQQYTDGSICDIGSKTARTTEVAEGRTYMKFWHVSS